MRRIFVLFLTVAMFILFVTACQETPEKPAVIRKDLEQMLGNAEKGDTEKSDGRSLSEQYGIPETYKFKFTSEDGKLDIIVDAQVTVPDANAMPIYRVKAADFTQEQVDALWNVFCRDREMWKSPQQQTKSEIQDSIVAWKRFMKDEGEEDNPEAQERLVQLQKALETAPETVEAVRADGKLGTMYWYKDPETKTQLLTSYTGLSAYEKVKTGGATFFVQNNNDLKEAYFVENKNGTGGGGMNVSRNAMIMYTDNSNPSANTNFGYSPSVPILKDEDLSADLLKNIGLKPSEAKKMVQDMLDEAHIDAVINSVYYLDDEQKGYVDNEVRPPKNYVYDIFCVRKVDGIPCAYIDRESRINENGEGEKAMMAPSWTYEKIEFRVNAQGIFGMEWWSPLEMIEKVNADSQLKPFSEIQEIFEKMMRIKYEAQAKIGKGAMRFDINRVTLSLQRIVEQNSYENGLLVPVWNFYGKLTFDYGEETPWEQIGVSFLSINAIDGSVIDTGKGY